MVMHRVLHSLGTSGGGRRILARVVSAVLVGDGDQVPDDRQVRFGAASLSAHGVGQALPAASHSSPGKFSRSLRSIVLSVCNAHDIVCDWTDENILCLDLAAGIKPPAMCALDIAIHLSYPRSKALIAAANRAARAVLNRGTPAGPVALENQVPTREADRQRRPSLAYR